MYLYKHTRTYVIRVSRFIICEKRERVVNVFAQKKIALKAISYKIIFTE